MACGSGVLYSLVSTLYFPSAILAILVKHLLYMGLWQAGGRLWSATDEGSVREAVSRALELGLNHFDTAEIYGWGRSERLLGSIIGNIDEVFIVSKVGGFRRSENDIVKAAKRIRERLRRDSIDLLLSHWPPPFYADICRVIHGLEKAVDKGYARSIGVSNYSSSLLEKAVYCTRKYEVKTDQVQYSLAYRTPELAIIPRAKELNITVMAWSPLAKGALAASTRRREPARMSDPVYRKVANDKCLHTVLERVSRELKLTKAQVSISWIQSKGVEPVVGVRKPKHVEELSEIQEYVLPDWAVQSLDGASRRYLDIWGETYKPLGKMRVLPGFIQLVLIKLIGGV